MKKTFMLIIALSLFVASPVLAMNGNELLDKCNHVIKYLDNNDSSVDSYKAGACYGYVEGLNSSHDFFTGYYKKEKIYCPPPGLTLNQAIRIFVKYLKEHPQDLHIDGSALFYKAIYQAAPCKK